MDTGTMDFLTSPLVEDGVWTVSRILPLWNITTPAQEQAYGMPHSMLSWTGVVPSLPRFLMGFVDIGVSEEAQWDEARLAPLAEYIETLRPPPLLQPVDEAARTRGAELFVTQGCLDCHNGPSGESRELFSFDEIGTDGATGQNVLRPQTTTETPLRVRVVDLSQCIVCSDLVEAEQF
ncbi:MAG: hypothetical protein AAFS10_24850, partial [Myxococcota bacterium]